MPALTFSAAGEKAKLLIATAFAATGAADAALPVPEGSIGMRIPGMAEAPGAVEAPCVVEAPGIPAVRC
ncbi:hypothetical protein GCM10011578_076160 [Streptomyces fuscichromogenes]|uniref:Uncharacterized protein n=1 Tax=Streptomyces fuscichromogenes TaxID=1324013 RepID=A0A918CVI7_9ACTN|nr:hypothetical protein GCM10011578_076160 [Streptomyces fuscichromogenes]